MSKDATKDEYTGGDVSYYVLEITHPKRFAPCTVECEDVIQALGMTFDEGCEFKAQWRSAAQRTLGLRKKGADEHGVYDAEKQVHYATRTLNYRRRLAGAAVPAIEPSFAALSATLKSFAEGEPIKFDMVPMPPAPKTTFALKNNAPPTGTCRVVDPDGAADRATIEMAIASAAARAMYNETHSWSRRAYCDIDLHLADLIASVKGEAPAPTTSAPPAKWRETIAGVGAIDGIKEVVQFIKKEMEGRAARDLEIARAVLRACQDAEHAKKRWPGLTSDLRDIIAGVKEPT